MMLMCIIYMYYNFENIDMSLPFYPTLIRPSVCPLCYLLLNHWTKVNQIWYMSYSHDRGVQRQTILDPPLGALGSGQKVSFACNFISITKSIQRFYTKLCVKDTKHIRRDLHSVAWGMPQGWDFRTLGVPRGPIFFFKHGYVAYQIDGDDEQTRMHW